MIISWSFLPGPWLWCVAGFLMILVELLIPSLIIIWSGCAAVLVGIISLLLQETLLWNWQIQTLLFSILSIALTIIGRHWAKNNKKSDEPLLNRRAESLIGRTIFLTKTLDKESSFISLDGTMWRISSPYVPKNTCVLVTEVKDNVLYVTPLNNTNS
ncbi:hypothetical protein B488_05780 [Liberibacter crescens BT-1]|uniref:NfeD-like C-terminal domain-containing protein n=1 Tax=Liberibacter crescens (strain BT-1) TaxID=1215343 RepID=L0EUR1_LIBCB|nr:NfeD family protein [Liberibacter crescens]AGA64570.1 hypothetical protein B488_05780 [Liberibacter crescens BT-1]